MIQTSVIIRTKNEGHIYHKVLQRLKEQTYQDFEIVAVDDNSNDGSDQLPLQYFHKTRVRLVTVTAGKFTHSYSCNLGGKNSNASDYLIYLNGHSIPVSKTWIKDGITSFKDEKVAGVFAWSLPARDANLFEKLLYDFNAYVLHNKKEIISRLSMGIFGTTGCIMKKSLWDQYSFNERYKNGGEDTEWANHWFKKGYVVIQDPKFRTYHSHNKGFVGMIKQYRKYKAMYDELSL